MKTKLPEIMELHNLNQKQVAQNTGLSPSTIGKLYRGTFERIDNNTIETLCYYFGLDSIADLIEIS